MHALVSVPENAKRRPSFSSPHPVKIAGWLAIVIAI
jgi:hypothetical protein